MSNLNEFWLSWKLFQVYWIDWKSCSDVEDDFLEFLKKCQCCQCSSEQKICENEKSYSSCAEHTIRILDNSWELYWQFSDHNDWQWWIFHSSLLLSVINRRNQFHSSCWYIYSLELMWWCLSAMIKNRHLTL